MFGPPGMMARAANGDYGFEIAEDYGLFPRGLITIFHAVKERYVSWATCEKSRGGGRSE